MTRLLALLALLLSAPALADAPAAPATGGATVSEAPAFSWNWGPEGTVSVQETDAEEGEELITHFKVSWGRAEDLTTVRFHGLEVDWEKSTAAHQGQRELLDAMAQIKPELTIDAAGYSVAASNLTPMIKVAIESMKGVPPEQMEQMKAVLLSPQMNLTMQSSLMQDWATWVASWVELSLADGEVREGVEEQANAMGTVVKQTLRYENLGPAPELAGAVQLKLTSTMDPESAREATMAVLEQFAAALEIPADKAPEFFSKAHIEIAFVQEVVADRATLRPYTARRTKTVRMTLPMEGMPPVDKSEVNTFVFTW